MDADDFGRLMLNLIRQKRIARLGTNPSWQKTPEDFWMRIDPLKSMDIAYFLGSYESELVRIIKLHPIAEDTAVEVATHKGYITLALTKTVRPSGSAVSVDPDPLAFAEMTANRRKDRFDEIMQKLPWKKYIFSRLHLSLQHIQSIQADDTFCSELLVMHGSDAGWKKNPTSCWMSDRSRADRNKDAIA